jgi:hypothetical protein
MLGESALWGSRNSDDVNRHANQDTLQRIVGMPRREPGDRAKEKDHRTQKEQQCVYRQICRAKPIVLARMRELVSQDPSTMGGKECRFQNDDMSDGDASQTFEASRGQAIEPCACRLAADALRPPATQKPGRTMSDEVGGRCPGCAKGTKCAVSSRGRDRDASHGLRLYLSWKSWEWPPIARL